MKKPLADREHVVYRMYDAADALLYIGVTSNLRARLTHHRAPTSRSARFIREVARITTETFPSKSAGEEAERRAIATEHPKFNVSFTSDADIVPDALFSSREVTELVGITYRQLDYWCRTELLKPSVSEASGSGSRRVFTMADVDHIRGLADAAQVCKWAQDGTIWRRVLNGQVWMVRVDEHGAERSDAA